MICNYFFNGTYVRMYTVVPGGAGLLLYYSREDLVLYALVAP